MLADGDRVALEIDWVGITVVQIEDLLPSSEMRDRAAIFLEFRDGHIACRDRTCSSFSDYFKSSCWWASLIAAVPALFLIVVAVAGLLGGGVARSYSEPMNQLMRARWETTAPNERLAAPLPIQ